MSIRDEVRASAAAHRDLGPGYEAAVAEGLVERIGEEIDKRVDARLYAQAPYQTPPRPRLRREPVPGRVGFGAVVLALGSMGMAIGATAAVLHPGASQGGVSGGATVLIALIWIVIGVVNVAYAWYRSLSAGLFVADTGTMYRALMSSDHEAEIRASVAAHADLGPGYDDAVAEGLVERIGAEIDKRIDARLGPEGAVPGPAGSPGSQGPAAPAGAQPEVPPPAGAAGMAGYQGYQAPAGYQGYQGYQGYMGPALPPGYQLGPPPVRPAPVGQRSVAMTITALGSMALGVAATAIVASHVSSSVAQAFMVLLIWVAIATINVAYARRP